MRELENHMVLGDYYKDDDVELSDETEAWHCEILSIDFAKLKQLGEKEKSENQRIINNRPRGF